MCSGWYNNKHNNKILKKTYYFYGLVFIVLILFVIRILDYFNIFTSYRFEQIYWHMTNKSVVENENIRLKIPIKWILAKETSNQFFFHGDYISKGHLKTFIIQKKPFAKEHIISDLNKYCLSDQMIYEKYNVNKKEFQLYGCKRLKNGGSLAYIVDDKLKFNMIVYDYKMTDREDIVGFLNALSIKE